MTDYTNGYFEMMRDIATGYENERNKRKAEKEALIKADDWDGVKAWNEREKKFPFSFSNGYMKAYRAWQETKINQSLIENHVDAIEVNDLPREEEVHDFVNYLREVGITEIAITDQSTALMRILHILEDEEDCQMYGLCKVRRSEKRWGEEGIEIYNGILMSI